MDISQMTFKTINKEDVVEKNKSKTFITLYHNSIYIPKSVSLWIKEKGYKFASISVSDSVIAIDFSRDEKENSFEVWLSPYDKNGIIYGIIGSVALSAQIAKELGIILDKNRYYKSIDSEIRDNIIYFQFDKSLCNFRKRK